MSHKHERINYIVKLCCPISTEPRCWLRLYWLIHRGFLQVLRDPSVQLIRILQKVVSNR